MVGHVNDLDQAIRELVTARLEIVAIPQDTQPRLRRAALLAPLARIGLASRFLDEIVDSLEVAS